MKKRSLLAMTLLTAMTVVGCASSSTQTTTTAAGTDTTTATASGEASAEEAIASVDLSENVEITIGGSSLGDSSSEVWPTDVVKEVEEMFNVTLTFKHYDQESLNLDLSGGNTTDIVQISDDNVEGVIKGKHAVNLLEYKNLASNIFSEDMEFRNVVMQNFKSNGVENAQYFVTPYVTFEDSQPTYGARLSYGYVVRWDLYKAIGMPEITDDDSYIEALKAMKEIYPETEDGLPVYAMSAYNEAELHTYFFKGCLTEGYVNLEGGIYVQDVKTNELVANIYDRGYDRTTAFWSGVEFYNKLYRAGLLDPDNFITKAEDLKDKYTKGQYLGGNVNWYFGTYNTNNLGTDKEYVVLPTQMGWYNEPTRAGWAGKYFFVSSHSPNVERAILVLDYLQSGDWSRSVRSGVEGRWEIGSDNLPHLTEDTIAMKTDETRTEEWSQSGIQNRNGKNVTGWAAENILPDGGMADLWNEESVMVQTLTTAEKELVEQYGVTLPSDILKNGIEAGTNFDLSTSNSAIRMCLEVVPKDITRIDSNVKELTMIALPSLIQAESDEEFATAKEALLKELEDADVQTSIDWWMSAWETSKSALEALDIK